MVEGVGKGPWGQVEVVDMRVNPLRVLVLGASGMLGSELVRSLSARSDIDVRGTVRDLGGLPMGFVDEFRGYLVEGVDVADTEGRRRAVADVDVVVNAVGVIKQASGLDDRVQTVRLNALLPQQLASECGSLGSRLIHISTDCVFSGARGGYVEADVPDPVDFYGRSKLLGEVGEPHLTLRTSIIGHELQRHGSLLDWFLGQPQTHVRGFVNAIYSGVTTTELAKLVGEVVTEHPDLTGLYHVASTPISKFDLLSIVAQQYGWSGEIERFDEFRCDRSMVAERLRDVIGYEPPGWSEMIQQMHGSRPAWAVTPSAEGLLR